MPRKIPRMEMELRNAHHSKETCMLHYQPRGSCDFQWCVSRVYLGLRRWMQSGVEGRGGGEGVGGDRGGGGAGARAQKNH